MCISACAKGIFVNLGDSEYENVHAYVYVYICVCTCVCACECVTLSSPWWTLAGVAGTSLNSVSLPQSWTPRKALWLCVLRLRWPSEFNLHQPGPSEACVTWCKYSNPHFR